MDWLPQGPSWSRRGNVRYRFLTNSETPARSKISKTPVQCLYSMLLCYRCFGPAIHSFLFVDTVRREGGREVESVQPSLSQNWTGYAGTWAPGMHSIAWQTRLDQAGWSNGVRSIAWRAVPGGALAWSPSHWSVFASTRLLQDYQRCRLCYTGWERGVDNCRMGGWKLDWWTADPFTHALHDPRIEEWVL